MTYEFNQTTTEINLLFQQPEVSEFDIIGYCNYISSFNINLIEFCVIIFTILFLIELMDLHNFLRPYMINLIDQGFHFFGVAFYILFGIYSLQNNDSTIFNFVSFLIPIVILRFIFDIYTKYIKTGVLQKLINNSGGTHERTRTRTKR